MSTMCVGMDVHSKKIFWCLQDADGNVVAEEECPTTPDDIFAMIRKHQLPCKTRVALESGSQVRWICHVLTQAGMVAEVLSAQEVRAKVHRRGQKSDRKDAFVICDGLRRDQYVARVWVPSPEISRLRQALSRRRFFISIRTAQINAVKGLLKTLSMPYRSKSLNSERAWGRLLAQYQNTSVGLAVQMHHEMWALAQKHVTTLDREIGEALQPFRETAELLQTAPGVGVITAATFIATVGDPGRFPSASHLGSYSGLAPSIYDSGEKQRHGSITKEGSSALRTALCEAAQHARRANNPLNPFYLRVKARSGEKKALVAVAHRLLRILYQMWKHNAAFDWHKLNVSYEPKTMSWTQYFHTEKNQVA